MEIKIVSINTWKCDGAYAERMVSLASQLALLKPQIVFCQECFQTEDGTTDTLAFLSDSLKLRASFLPCRPKKRFFQGSWVESFSGMGVLSAFPIVAEEGFELPFMAADPGRKMQKLDVEIKPGLYLSLFNVHLTHNLPGGKEIRKEQLHFISSIFNQQTDRIRLVAGDFNCEASSAELGSFIQSAAVSDTYVLAKGGEPRYSMLDCFERRQPYCIDYIFSSPLSDSVIPSVFENGAVVLNQPAAGGVYPSDHFGMSVDLIVQE